MSSFLFGFGQLGHFYKAQRDDENMQCLNEGACFSLLFCLLWHHKIRTSISNLTLFIGNTYVGWRYVFLLNIPVTLFDDGEITAWVEGRGSEFLMNLWVELHTCRVEKDSEGGTARPRRDNKYGGSWLNNCIWERKKNHLAGHDFHSDSREATNLIKRSASN